MYFIFKSKIGKSKLLRAQDDYGIVIASLRLAHRSHREESPPPHTQPLNLRSDWGKAGGAAEASRVVKDHLD
jgi:hypothetical protein